MRRVASLYIFTDLFNEFLFNRRHLESCICLCITPVAISYFGWNIQRKPSMAQICSWWRKEYYSLLYNCVFSLILYQNSTNDSFLKVNCNMESETRFCSILVFQSFIHAWFITCVGDLNQLVHCVMQNSRFWHISFYSNLPP